jgi:PAS domain S-box-containing protein
LLLQSAPSPPRIALRSAQAISVVTGAVAATVLLEYVTDRSFGLDRWWFEAAVTTMGATYPGRPALQTAIAVVALAPVVALARVDRSWARPVWTIGLTIGLAVPIVAVGGYVYRLATIFTVTVPNWMALPSTLGVLMLGVTCALLRADRPPLSAFDRLRIRAPLVRSLVALAGLPLVAAIVRDVSVALGVEPYTGLVIGLVIATILAAAVVFASSAKEQRAVDEELRLAEDLAQATVRNRLLAEHGSDVLVAGAFDGGIDLMSPSVTEALGWQAEDLVGHNLLGYVHPDDQATALAALQELQRTGRSTCEVRLLRKSGEYRWFSGRFRPWSDDAGRVLGRVTNWRDIEAEHRARVEVLEARTMLREHVDAVLDPLVLCQAVRDDSGQIVDFTYLDVNEATCRYLSLDRPDLVGSGMLAGMPGLAEAGLLAAYAHAVDTGEPVSFDGFRYANEILASRPTTTFAAVPCRTID